ncbi:MAG: class 1 isoprenoid biosynthesis enzyme [Bacteroidota bacterium]
MRRFTLFFHSPFLAYKMVRNLQQQKKFIQDYISGQLEVARTENDGSLDESDFKKITSYYGLAVPAILGEAFCALHGRKMTSKERMASTCQGAITGLFDDFFDKRLISDQELKAFIERPKQLTGNTSSEKLFLYFYRMALENAAEPKLMMEHLYRVFHAQVDSKKQVNSDLSSDEIKAITFLKGGTSLVFYRMAFTPSFGKDEEDMLLRLGGLMQLSNDIFDVYKDLQHRIRTLATTTRDIREIRKLFGELLKDGYSSARKTQYRKDNVERFLDIISLGIFSRSFVCLDQLEERQRLSNNVFSPQHYSRSDLICDMDNPGNKWKSLMYHLKYIQ